jgi:hypothetical protein
LILTGVGLSEEDDYFLVNILAAKLYDKRA